MIFIKNNKFYIIVIQVKNDNPIDELSYATLPQPEHSAEQRRRRNGEVVALQFASKQLYIRTGVEKGPGGGLIG